MPLQKLLQDDFSPSAYFFNPNIHLQEEYLLRLFAMQQVANLYKIPLIIQGNATYFKNIKESLLQNPVNITKIHHRALQACVPFLQNKNMENNNKNKKDNFDLNWDTALKKIQAKWKKYSDEFPKFDTENQAIFAQKSIFTPHEDETPLDVTFDLKVNAPLFVARLEQTKKSTQNKPSQNKFYDTTQNHKKHTENNLNTPNNATARQAQISPFVEVERCKKCYEERLYQSARYASEHGFSLFTSTLLYSCYQNHDDICNAAKLAEERVNQENKILKQEVKNKNTNNPIPISFYYQDFRTYWQQGIDSSKEHKLYRQKYCGCVLSRLESLERMVKRYYSNST